MTTPSDADRPPVEAPGASAVFSPGGDIFPETCDAAGGVHSIDLPAGAASGQYGTGRQGDAEPVPGGESAEADATRPEAVETVSDLEVEADPSALAASLQRDTSDASGGVLLDVSDLKVHFPIKSGVFVDRTVGYVYAVDGVSLQVRRGETYGLVGESGCGKTTLGRAILRLTEPTAGRVLFDGVDVASLRRPQLRRVRQRMQMVFQDPLSSLDPRQSVQSILVEGMRAHGLDTGTAATNKRLRDLLAAVGLPARALQKYPHEFSGGQRQRIGVARALTVNPELIVADEPVSALDVSVQAQVLNLLEDLQDSLGLTYIVIAHDLAVVKHISDRVGVMYLGSLVEESPAEELYEHPMHPYTRALMSAVPVPDPLVEDRRERILLTGDLPSPANPPSGCRFHTRCPWRQETKCDTDRPALLELAPGHRVACHWAKDIADGVIRPTTPVAEPDLV